MAAKGATVAYGNTMMRGEGLPPRTQRLQLLHSADYPRRHQRNIFCFQDDWLPLDGCTEHFGVQHPHLGHALCVDLHEPARQQDHRSDWKPLARALEKLVAEPPRQRLGLPSRIAFERDALHEEPFPIELHDGVTLARLTIGLRFKGKNAMR
jgi:hypothetical protein